MTQVFLKGLWRGGGLRKFDWEEFMLLPLGFIRTLLKKTYFINDSIFNKITYC